VSVVQKAVSPGLVILQDNVIGVFLLFLNLFDGFWHTECLYLFDGYSLCREVDRFQSGTS
ncbi:MAG: hypothetical protein ACP5D0_10350, partial [Hydrogenovibrio sp.]